LSHTSYTSYIKQIPRILSRCLESVCSCLASPQFALSFSSVTALALSPPNSALLLTFILRQRRRSPFSSKSYMPPFRANMRPTIARSRPAQKEHPSILAALSFPHHHPPISMLSSPIHTVRNGGPQTSSPPKAFRSIKPSRRPL
jgi:hypothetical protein